MSHGSAPSADTVVVWRVPLDGGAAPLDAGLLLLDDAERREAALMRHEGTRRAFVLVRAALRGILGEMLGAAPPTLGLARTPAGKPFLVDEPSLQFSVSHGGDWGLVAVTRAGPVGVDVEALQPVPERDAIAAALFTPEEQAALVRAPAEVRPLLFLDIWVRREALLKAAGAGLGKPFASGLERFVVEGLPVPPGYRAALARPRAAAFTVLR